MQVGGDRALDRIANDGDESRTGQMRSQHLGIVPGNDSNPIAALQWEGQKAFSVACVRFTTSEDPPFLGRKCSRKIGSPERRASRLWDVIED